MRNQETEAHAQGSRDIHRHTTPGRAQEFQASWITFTYFSKSAITSARGLPSGIQNIPHAEELLWPVCYHFNTQSSGNSLTGPGGVTTGSGCARFEINNARGVGIIWMPGWLSLRPNLMSMEAEKPIHLSHVCIVARKFGSFIWFCITTDWRPEAKWNYSRETRSVDWDLLPGLVLIRQGDVQPGYL